MNSTVPVLDKYDSQIMLLSKGHFSEELNDFDNPTIDGLRTLWAWRCDIPLKYVELRNILGHLIRLLEKVNLLSSNEVIDIISNGCFDNMLWRIGIQDKDIPMIEKLVRSCMGTLSTLQVMESVEIDGERVSADLISYEEKDNSFIRLLEEEDKEDEV